MRALVVTVSDRVARHEAEDRSGPAAAARLEALGFVPVVRVVPDGVASVRDALEAAVFEGFDLVVTAGGTGFGPRDLTPEATREVVERMAPGISEAMRAATFGKNPFGMLSRGMAGIAGSTLIINLPGSVGGVTESLDAVGGALGHAVSLLSGEPSGH
jgi:molybdenum cofactor synthesis domain-containing protein